MKHQQRRAATRTIEAERDDAVRQVAAVTTLHVPGSVGDFDIVCVGCGNEWPCETLAVIERTAKAPT